MANSSIPFLLRIGVSGPRHLSNPEAIRARVKEVLEQLVFQVFDDPQKIKDKFYGQQHHTPSRYCILSQLAEGTDQLVTAQALEYADTRIQAVLPFSQEAYLIQFDDENGKKEFHRLLLL